MRVAKASASNATPPVILSKPRYAEPMLSTKGDLDRLTGAERYL